MNPMNFQNPNYIQKNSNFLDKNDFMNNYGNDDRQKNNIDLIDQRNLQNLILFNYFHNLINLQLIYMDQICLIVKNKKI